MRFVLSVLILCISAPALAGIPCIIVNIDVDGAPGVALITPSGTGPSLADRGYVVNVEILDCGLIPVAHFPFQDIWITGWNDGEVWLCQGGSSADANTDEFGRTTISGAISGGGHSTGGTIVYVAGNSMTTPGPLPLNLVSPDIDGDLDVDIVDFTNFGFDFGTTAMRSDFVYDGIVDLADFAIFGVHFGTNCP